MAQYAVASREEKESVYVLNRLSLSRSINTCVCVCVCVCLSVCLSVSVCVCVHVHIILYRRCRFPVRGCGGGSSWNEDVEEEEVLCVGMRRTLLGTHPFRCDGSKKRKRRFYCPSLPNDRR